MYTEQTIRVDSLVVGDCFNVPRTSTEFSPRLTYMVLSQVPSHVVMETSWTEILATDGRVTSISGDWQVVRCSIEDFDFLANIARSGAIKRDAVVQSIGFE